MPDPVDFDRVARLLVHELDSISHDLDAREAVVLMREQFRLIWNARGAADAQVVDVRIRELVAGQIVGAGIARHVAEAITKQDR